MTLSLGDVSTLVGLGTAAYSGVIGARGWYRRTWGSRRELSEKINRLACGVTDAYVEELLGNATFGSIATVSEVDCEVRHYWCRHAWVSTLHEDGIVVGFSVTTVDRRFRPSVDLMSFGYLHARLGVTRFDELPEVDENRRYWLGARRYEYSEVHYFGNPAGYQSYALSHNDCGVGAIGLPDSPATYHVDGVFRAKDEDHELLGSDEVRRIRHETTVNTVTVFRPHWMPDLNAWQPIGVDGDMVRVFPAAMSGKMRRYIKNGEH